MTIEKMRLRLAILFHQIECPDISLWNAILQGTSSGSGTKTTCMLALRGVHVILGINYSVRSPATNKNAPRHPKNVPRSIPSITGRFSRPVSAQNNFSILGVRNVSADNNVKEMILKEIPTAKVDALELDLRSMASVSKIAADFNSLNLPLNILINNAGVGMSSFMLSQDGIEMNFATDHIGHFLLTNLLLENMKVTASKSGMEERLVIVASEAYKFSYRQGIRFYKINEKYQFNGFAAYGLEADSFVQNSFLCCNAKGCSESACKLFDELTEKNLFL